MALFTVETSHGKARVTRPRPSDLGTVPTDADRSANHTAAGTFATNNQAAVGRSAKAALRAPYRQAERRVTEALATQAGPSDSDRVLADALAVFHAARRELGCGSPLVQGAMIAYAVETVLAGYFMAAAAAAGFTTERGLAMHERAMLCETQAGRALAVALAAARAISANKAARPRNSIQELEKLMRRMERRNAVSLHSGNLPTAPSPDASRLGERVDQ